MAECKACKQWFGTSTPTDLCPTCERALKRLKGYAEPVQEFIDYIDKAFKERSHGDSFWIDEREHTHGADVGYAWEWWTDCMRPELLRVFGERRDGDG